MGDRVLERHYKPSQIAQSWGVSTDTIRRMFESEPGVLVLGDAAGGRGKRRYRTMTIPESVLVRVYERRTKA